MKAKSAASIVAGAAVLFPLLSQSAETPLDSARTLLREGQVAKAAEAVNVALGTKPGDPWLLYDTAVAAYAAKDYAKADEIWEQLAGTALPPGLIDHVWTQIGNVSYRLVQDQYSKEPDMAVSGLEQSREAFRVALSHDKKSKIAKENLALVEKELEKIYAQLAQRLVSEAKKETQLERSIEKLEAALNYQQSSDALAPKDAAHEQATKEIERMLAEKFDTKAAKSEEQASRADQNNEWQRQQAKEQLETALADFRQAETYDQQDQTARNGEQRVEQKLADLLDKAGRQKQQEARNEARYNPQAALDRYDTALQDFQQAQEMKPDHQDAREGEHEVKQEMEKIHLDQGDRQQLAAEQQAKHQPEQAAGQMLGALEHFEQARDLHPDSKEIQDRIDRVQQELPDLLMAMAKREQQEAAQAEPKSPENAVAHLERAETALDKAEQADPKNQQAQAMQQQVQSDLARLRQQLAQQAEQKQQQQQQQQNQQPQNQQNFANMLAQVKATQEQKDVNVRHQPPRKYDPTSAAAFRNW